MRDDFWQANFSVTVELIVGFNEHGFSQVKVGGVVCVGDIEILPSCSGDGQFGVQRVFWLGNILHDVVYYQQSVVFGK